MTTADLHLSLPWAPQAVQELDELAVQRDSTNFLAYNDGITLAVRVLDPGAWTSVEHLISQAKLEEGPGRVVLVAGAVPLPWRAPLRSAGVSFIDASGIVELNWPRLRISARRFARSVRRERSPIPLQKSHARVIQELLIATTLGQRPTVGEIAAGADASPAIASRAIAQLAEHGWVAKERRGKRVHVVVNDRVAIAERLAERTAWGHVEVLHAYVWGRSFWEIAAKLSKAAIRGHIALAVTGRAGAAYYGVLGTASPGEVRCWVSVKGKSLEQVAELLDLDPAPKSEANVILSSDLWRLGVHRSRSMTSEASTATIAHPLRVWCDLRDEPRGVDFAAQIWGVIERGG